ncbi:MAG: right-handed parallel beta-helix repeat-containing protein [Actinomycetota bacterium]
MALFGLFTRVLTTLLLTTVPVAGSGLTAAQMTAAWGGSSWGGFSWGGSSFYRSARMMPFAHPVIMLSRTSDRSDPVRLDGSEVTGSVYVFIGDLGRRATVRFYLDDPLTAGPPVTIEKEAPYDLLGASLLGPHPLHTETLGAGPHSVTAVVDYDRHLADVVVSRSFSVPPPPEPPPTAPSPAPTDASSGWGSSGGGSSSGSSTPSEPPTQSPVAEGSDFLVSATPDRASPVVLEGSTIAGTAYVFLPAPTGTSSVSFYLDDPATLGPPRQVEMVAPFDLAGGTVQTAQGLDTTQLANGEHVVVATEMSASGAVRRSEARFDVANPEPGVQTPPPPSPSPSPTPAAPAPAPTAGPSPTPTDTTCTGVRVDAGGDLPRAIATHPDGTSFCLGPGVHRLRSSLEPKPGQKLLGAGAGRTVISGARPVSAEKSGSFWVIEGQTSLGTSRFSGTSNQCRHVDGRDPRGMCIYKDQVFLDDMSLWQVGSPAETKPGTFFWDYSSNKIYLSDNPSGRRLEVSVVDETAISGGSAGVVVKDLTVERFGNSIQGGAVSAGRNWTIEGTEVRQNHGGGVHMGMGTVVRANHIHHNGQLGIHGGQAPCSKATGLVVEDNVISYNNIAGYNWAWEGGATKWTHTDGLVVRRNHVHHNYGVGLWTDADNIRTVYEDNLVENNYGEGINHELSFDAIIRRNVIRGNGFHHPVQGKAWGAGIFIDQSPNVKVLNNVVENNNAGITAVQQPEGSSQCGYGTREVRNLLVESNKIRQPTGIAAGLQLLSTSNTAYYLQKNNHWRTNEYVLGSLSGKHFRWIAGDVDLPTWKSYGHS